MREIKFRGIALEGNSKGKFVYGFYAEKEHEYDDDMWETTYGIYTSEGMVWEEIERDSACQFTGLLDKNRKEIYCGDIVSYATNMGDKGNILKGWRTAEVKDEGVYGYTPWSNGIVMGVEVIGNIFENSELISK